MRAGLRRAAAAAPAHSRALAALRTAARAARNGGTALRLASQARLASTPRCLASRAYGTSLLSLSVADLQRVGGRRGVPAVARSARVDAHHASPTVDGDRHPVLQDACANARSNH